MKPCFYSSGFFNERENPSPSPAARSLAPFGRYQTDPLEDPAVSRHTMLVYTPEGMKRAARILVEVFHITLSLHTELTHVVGPHLVSGEGAADHLVIEAQRGRHGSHVGPWLDFRLFLEGPSDTAVRELQAVGFEWDAQKSGTYDVFQRIENV